MLAPGNGGQPCGNRGRLVSPTGEILVNSRLYPHLHRALSRAMTLGRQRHEEWARVVELRKTQPLEADRLVRKLLGVHGQPMPEETKAALRARQAAMTPEEKKAARDARRAQRVLRRLAARATGRANGSIFSQEADVAKKGKAKAKSKDTRPSIDEVRKNLKVKAKKEGAAIAPQPQPGSTKRAPKAERDPRLPAVGAVITREWHEKKYEVLVDEQDWEIDGKKVKRTVFVYEGETFPSLTAIAKKITGAYSINGFLFFGLTKNAPVVAQA